MVTLLYTDREKTSGLTVVPLGEKRLLVMAGPLGDPRKGEQKGEDSNNQRDEFTR